VYRINYISFHICHPGVFLLTYIISLLSVIHTIYSIKIVMLYNLDLSKKKVKAVCGSYSTAALRHIVLLPE